MVDLIIPGTDIKVSELELDRVVKAIGGKLLIKELPYFPPIDCTQASGCFEHAEYVVIMLTADKGDDTICTLCQMHLNRLLDYQQLMIPINVVH